MVSSEVSAEQIREWLAEIADPEIPVLSIVDLGILRSVERPEGSDEWVIAVTPTYSGCPAFEAIEQEIRFCMKQRGIERFRIEKRIAPAWTTDWMSDEARERLREFGIAPPSRLIPAAEIAAGPTRARNIPEDLSCPHCGSAHIALISGYGSTACKALYKCRACLEPFDAFKRH